MLDDWLILVFAIVFCVAVFKFVGSDVLDLQRRLARMNDSDPVVDFFAWFDRVTSLKRR